MDKCVVLEGDEATGLWLSELDSTTGIPYSSVMGEDGHSNCSYVDLRANPERISSIPELTDVPDFRALVEFMNGPESVFSSVGCEKALMTATPGSQEMNGYLQLVFANRTLNENRNNFINLYHRFELFLKTRRRDSQAFNFEIN